MQLETCIKTLFAVIATCITTAFGGWDMALQVLIIAIVADYLTGVAKAFCLKN